MQLLSQIHSRDLNFRGDKNVHGHPVRSTEYTAHSTLGTNIIHGMIIHYYYGWIRTEYSDLYYSVLHTQSRKGYRGQLSSRGQDATVPTSVVFSSFFLFFFSGCELVGRLGLGDFSLTQAKAISRRSTEHGLLRSPYGVLSQVGKVPNVMMMKQATTNTYELLSTELKYRFIYSVYGVLRTNMFLHISNK
ncbi:hypothetical protein T310_7672 [Rasamsonia emersonii CBS 393.64]|uniref:Uncharacterized protein n=1 Tax=Rasamsonia emersonii (strain ATCC 16479 / CBS 393.64 / IMI 116815) TaxID=1408163 RepID=A0A0F4YJB3_RASE3|nr:hypothetical protein T310_7672 [Rasamsonia emersonii CBS 393.64]KKA18382.1 hypothetical protein T310_7672 [Rasamsonia emersonii CBS 393.64]